MPSFETGVRLLKNILIKKRSYSAFFADETDALHLSFIEESQIISREPLSTRGSLIF